MSNHDLVDQALNDLNTIAESANFDFVVDDVSVIDDESSAVEVNERYVRIKLNMQSRFNKTRFNMGQDDAELKYNLVSINPSSEGEFQVHIRSM